MFSVKKLQTSESVFFYQISYITVIVILVQSQKQTHVGQGMLVKLTYEDY